MSTQSCKPDPCRPMGLPYEVCACKVVYFAFCEAGEGEDDNGTPISKIPYKNSFDIRIRVETRKLAVRVGATAQFQDSAGTIDLPLDNVKYLWDPASAKILPCEVVPDQYNLSYDDIDVNTLKVTKATPGEGIAPIQADQSIRQGQMIGFADPGCFAKLGGYIKLTAENLNTPSSLVKFDSLRVKEQSFSDGVCVFDRIKVTHGVDPTETIRIGAYFCPDENGPGDIKCMRAEDMPVITTCNDCDPAIPGTLYATCGGVSGDFAFAGGTHRLTWGGGCAWSCFELDPDQEIHLEYVRAEWFAFVRAHIDVACEILWSGDTPGELCNPEGESYVFVNCADENCDDTDSCGDDPNPSFSVSTS